MYKSIRKNLKEKRCEAFESVMCDVIRIRLKRWIATRRGKGNQPLNIKTALEWPILKDYQILGGAFISFNSLCFLPFRRIFMTSYMTLSSASWREKVTEL